MLSIGIFCAFQFCYIFLFKHLLCWHSCSFCTNVYLFIYLFQWISSLNPWLSIFPFPGNSGYLRLTICIHTLAVKLWVALAKAGEFWLVDEISSIKPAFPNHAAANTKISDQMPKNELSSFIFFFFLFYILPSFPFPICGNSHWPFRQTFVTSVSKNRSFVFV